MSEHSIPIQCACGAFQARLQATRRALHLACYCRDCQSFAHYVAALAPARAGTAPLALNSQGGTEIIAVAPEHLVLEQGVDQLRCMSLSAAGTYRWYSACCGSALAVLPHQAKLAHVSILATTLRDAGVDVAAEFGPTRLVANRASAHGRVPAPAAWRQRLAFATYGLGLLYQRLTGRWRKTPFLQHGSWQPIVAVQVLERSQRQQLQQLAAQPPYVS